MLKAKFSRSLARIGFVLILFISLLAPVAPAEASNDAAWNVACPISHFGADDPIVKPNMPGASHMHSFYGNVSTNAATTEQSLLANPSTCERGFSNTDHSAYWIPSLYRTLPNGTIQQISGTTKTLRMTIYYRGGDKSNQKVTPFPQGLRMVAGDATATSPQPLSVVNWRCKDTDGGANTETDQTATIPTCNTNQSLDAEVRFPNCWDGKSLDSADHKSHMAYLTGKACPSDHPVRMPQVTFVIVYKGINGPASQYQLSSGGQYSMHGDFFAAWDNQVQSALVNSCINDPDNCTGIERKDVKLSAATPGSGSSQVLADQTSAPATPTAVHPATAATALPTTGPASATLGAIGAAGTALAIAANRRRRSALLRALRHSSSPRL